MPLIFQAGPWALQQPHKHTVVNYSHYIEQAIWVQGDFIKVTRPHQSILIALERFAGHIKVTYPLLIMVTAVITSTGVQVISISGIHRQIIIVHLVYCFNNWT